VIASDDVALTTQHHCLGLALDLLGAFGQDQRNERVRTVDHQLTRSCRRAPHAEDIKQVPRRELRHRLQSTVKTMRDPMGALPPGGPLGA
jgi:hypothetical protein